jgi:hypothetical protein
VSLRRVSGSRLGIIDRGVPDEALSIHLSLYGKRGSYMGKGTRGVLAANDRKKASHRNFDLLDLSLIVN